MAAIVRIVALIGVSSAAAAGRLQSCYGCSSSTASSPCHLQPPRRPETTVRCAQSTAHCVIERLQTADGQLISIQRRCSSREETKQAHNRCERTSSGTRCLTLCYGSFCNFGTGQLFQEGHPWDYDDPEYADYIYDPEQAVLSSRNRSYSGPFPAGSEEFPAARTVALVEAGGSAAVVTSPALMGTMAMVVAVWSGEAW